MRLNPVFVSQGRSQTGALITIPHTEYSLYYEYQVLNYTEKAPKCRSARTAVIMLFLCAYECVLSQKKWFVFGLFAHACCSVFFPTSTKKEDAGKTPKLGLLVDDDID